MEFFIAGEPEQFVDHLIHLDTQQQAHGVDLTVDAMFSIESPGALDFGGGEFEPAGRREISPELAKEDDDYGWWDLDGGTYLIRYNEVVDPGEGLAVIRPLPRLVATGSSHPCVMCSASDKPGGVLETVLRVSEAGVRIKENARVSRLVVYG